jgi:radical SAM family RiPP maturation amino acid epimerase
VSHTKRALERWTMDPEFRAKFQQAPEQALAALGVELAPDQVAPLVFDDLAREMSEARSRGVPDVYPESVVRYHAFIQEKIDHRGQTRAEGGSDHPRLKAWRRRQINRCIGELGIQRSGAIVHAPMAIELSKGCTVGCWFCGVAAPRFEHTWPYTERNGRLWRECLKGLCETLGTGVRQGFLYWATDPLDNPDYERFLVDFHAELGRCPQTTTAIAHKDFERTRRLVALAHGMGSSVDRFSITTLRTLRRVHEALSAEELLRVELVPQNKEAAAEHPKSNSGRAMRFAEKRREELVRPEASSTIACVSGFLINMVEGSVKLITPCDANERWPLGYWILDQRTFASAEELTEGVTSMIDRHVRAGVGPDDVVRLRRDVATTTRDREITVRCRGMSLTFKDQRDPEGLVALIEKGSLAVQTLAAVREREAAVPLFATLGVIDQLFAHGMFDEEPIGRDEPVRADDMLALRER